MGWDVVARTELLSYRLHPKYQAYQTLLTLLLLNPLPPGLSLSVTLSDHGDEHPISAKPSLPWLPTRHPTTTRLVDDGSEYRPDGTTAIHATTSATISSYARGGYGGILQHTRSTGWTTTTTPARNADAAWNAWNGRDARYAWTWRTKLSSESDAACNESDSTCTKAKEKARGESQDAERTFQGRLSGADICSPNLEITLRAK